MAMQAIAPSFFACSPALLPKTSPPAAMPKTCGRCGSPCACAKFCGTCFTLSCTTCMAEGEASCLHCAPSVSEFLVEQACNDDLTMPPGDFSNSCDSPVCVDESEQQCGNCGNRCQSMKHCYGCATTVCDNCMDDKEASCLLCLQTYPTYPPHASKRGRSRPVAAPVLTTVAPICASSYLTIDQLLTQPLQAPQTGLLLAPLTSTKPPQDAGCFKRTTVDTASPRPKRQVSGSSTICPESPTRLWSDVEDGSAESTCCDEQESDGGSSKEQKEGTTVMVCNIPCRLSQDAIVDAIHSAGYAGTYDFVYLPDRKNRRANGARTSGNIGYAFVDFKTIQHAEAFAISFHNYRFPGTHSAKRCAIKYADCQGFNAKDAKEAPTRRIRGW